MCDEILWKIVTKVHRYSDGFGKIVKKFLMNFGRYCDDDFKFKILFIV
jgi:hypothetical protein